MSGFYLIIPEVGKADQLRIVPETFAKQISARWDNFEVINVNIPKDTSALSWRCKVQGEELLGNLLEGENTITLNDWSDKAVAQFAVWYRSLIPKHIPLFLCHDQSAATEIEITEYITVDEILQQLDQVD
jgi:hypothetical protein